MRFRLLLAFCLLFHCVAFAQGPQLPPSAPSAPSVPPSAPPFSAPPPAPIGKPPVGVTSWRPAPTLDELRAHLEKLEKQSNALEIPKDLQNLALLRFKLEQGRLYLAALEDNTAFLWREDLQRRFAAALDWVDVIGQTQGDASMTPLSFHERAYIARADGSVQPYWIYLPQGYSSRRSYPLAVFLHGYDPALTKIEPWLLSEEMQKIASRRGVIVAVPYGRRNSDFIHIGEDDTLRVADEAQKLYSVDPQRVFLMGVSMGGYGVYAVGLHHPDRFAGASAMCGRTDTYLWLRLDRDALPDWKRILYDADDPQLLRRNALNLPFQIQHGARDNIVPTEHSRRIVADLKRLNYNVRYTEYPNLDHFIYFDETVLDNALSWVSQNRALPPSRRMTYTTGSLRDNHSRWAAIDAFEDYTQLATITAEVKARNVVEVNLENVAAFTLTPPFGWLDAKLPITLKVNGVAGVLPPGGTSLQWRKNPAPETKALEKTPTRSGPIKKCYRDPFLLVYGTLGGTQDQVQARRFAHEWQLYADGIPPIKSDTQVSADDYERYNLILFGTRQTNALLAQIADKLPVELLPDGYRLGEKTVVVPGLELGAQLCYPSPWNKERMIVVQSGLYWGGALPLNHKFDLLPEYIVYSDKIDFSDNTNRALIAGFFDHNWNLPK